MKQSTLARKVDATPITNSHALVESGGVRAELDALSARIGSVESPAQTAIEVPFTLAVSSWSGSGPYTATFSSSSIITDSVILQPNITGGFAELDPVWSWERSGNAVKFTVETMPTAAVTGTIPVIYSINGVVPVARGGTGIAASSTSDLIDQLGVSRKAIVVDMGTISSLPVTKTATGVTAAMVCIAHEFGTPSAFASDISVTTGANSVQLSGTMTSGTSSTVKLTLIEATQVTAS